MPSFDVVRAEVNEFFREHATGSTPADAFAPWWMWRKHQVAPSDAARRAPQGSYDFGLDGFHVECDDRGEVTLHLIQAKFSSSASEIKKAIQGFDRAMPQLTCVLERREVSGPIVNPIFSQLTVALDKYLDDINSGNKRLKLAFEVLHLVDAPRESLMRNVSHQLEQFKDSAETHFPDHVSSIALIDLPSELIDPHAQTVAPILKQVIRFEGKQITTDSNAQFLAGFGYLSDLVDLYRHNGEALFSKNVRAFLYRASDKGPAKFMRESIRESCIPTRAGVFKSSPDRFALLHNGVTISARRAEFRGDMLELRDPNVINGCQTVKNAAIFVQETNVRDRIDPKQFKAIRIPLRVLVTKDEELLRDVTISNNRQNSIRPSAFRANDPTQLDLATRFAAIGIFYERQEQAFENLLRSDAKKITEEYGQSEAPLTMEQLAQAIALVANAPALSTASKVSEVFEESVYKTLFVTERVSHLELLVFLRNMLVVLPLVVRDVMSKTQKFDSAQSKKKFAYPVMRILARYIVMHHDELVRTHGKSVVRKAGPQHPLRKRLGQLMAAQNSKLQQRLHENWFDKHKNEWLNPLDADCCKEVLKGMHLDSIDVFEAWSASQQP